MGDSHAVLIVRQQLVCYKEGFDRAQAANPAEELQCSFEARAHTLQLFLLCMVAAEHVVRRPALPCMQLCWCVGAGRTHLQLHGLQHQVLQALKQCSVEGSWNQLLTLLPTC